MGRVDTGRFKSRQKAGVQRAQPFAGARGALAFTPFLAAEGGNRGLLNRPGVDTIRVVFARMMCYLVLEEHHIWCSTKTPSLRIIRKAHMEVTHGYNTDPVANRRRLFRELQL